MGFFFIGGITHLGDFHIKGQALASQRMVGIHIDIEAPDFHHRYLNRALLGLQADDLAGFQRLGIAEMFGRNPLYIGSPAFAVSFRWFHRHFKTVTRSLSFHRLFQALDDVSGTMKVSHGIPFAGSFQLFALGIFEGVVKADDRMFADVHDG